MGQIAVFLPDYRLTQIRFKTRKWVPGLPCHFGPKSDDCLRSWLWEFHPAHLLNIEENTHPRNVKIMHKTRVPWTTQQHAGNSFYTSKTAKSFLYFFKRTVSEKGTFLPFKDLLITIFFKELSSDGAGNILWSTVVCKFTAQHTGTQI